MDVWYFTGLFGSAFCGAAAVYVAHKKERLYPAVLTFLAIASGTVSAAGLIKG